jgi:hypothetical protein
LNIFVIHSGNDKKTVENYINDLKNCTFGINVLIMGGNNKKWKTEAKNKLKKSQLVLFIVGESSHKSTNIDWEITEAIKLRREIVTIKLNDNYKYNSVLTRKDSYTDDEYQVNKEMTICELSKYINDFENGTTKIFNEDKMDKDRLFEQYKLFLHTSEDLVTRRQVINNFYITINSILISLFATLVTLLIKEPYLFVLVLIFCTVGIVVSTSWKKIIISYGNLNACKMRIVSIIERDLPLSLFDSEWALLSHKLNRKKYVSFTESEAKIPKIFIILYSITLILTLLYSMFKYL